MSSQSAVYLVAAIYAGDADRDEFWRDFARLDTAGKKLVHLAFDEVEADERGRVMV
jgi:hypothetical protein